MDSEKIIQLAIFEFQNVLRANLGHEWEKQLGEPPNDAYIEQWEYSEKPMVVMPILRAWRLTSEKIVALEKPEQRVDEIKTKGMFFDCLLGHFSISEDSKNLSVNWQTGPRFGRGFVFPVIRNGDGEIVLGKAKPTWVS